MQNKMGELAVARKWITTEELDEILAYQRKLRLLGNGEEKTLLGRLLVKEGLISDAVLDALLREQRGEISFDAFYRGKSFSFGPYRIGNLLAAGGAGAVYRASRDENPVAIKIIRNREFTGKVRARFLREIKILSGLDHPNVVKIHDCGQISGVDFLAMDYLPGKTMEQALHDPCNCSIWLEKFIGLLHGVSAMHEQNIVHRDLKPGNIMLSEGKLVIFDFGLGKILEQSVDSISTQIAGTPAYMAPEQTVPLGYHDNRTDIWALGVILYRLISGKMPFAQKRTRELFESIRHRRPQSVISHVPDLPAGLNDICMRALEKKQENRYQSAAQMAQAIIQVTTEFAGVSLPLKDDSCKKDHLSEQDKPSNCKHDMFLHYRIEEHLGSGGMGTVYKAYDTRLKRIVALKLLLPECELNERQTARFLREAMALASLRHPGIVAVYEVGEHPQHYFTMEYVAGKTLATCMRMENIPPKKAATICSKVAMALSQAHIQGIVHRDIKPSNIMLDAHREPILMDFGLARTSESDLSKSGDVLGTLAYMAPEQADGRRASIRSDIYSLGATLYQILAGRTPYQGSHGQVLHQIFFEDPISPKNLNPGVPPELEAICLKCLEKKPAKRYRDAAQLAQDLDNFLHNRPVSAKSPNALTYAWKFFLRHRSFSLTALTLFVALTAGGLFSFVQWQRAEKAKKEKESEFRRAEDQRVKAEIQRRLKTRQARAADIRLAKIAFQEAGEQYDAKEYAWCGALAGAGLQSIKGLSGPDIDLLRRRGKNLVIMALRQRGLRWESESPYGLSYKLAFSPDGSKIATLGKDRTIRIWNVNGRQIEKFGDPEFISPVPFIAALAYGPGEKIASAACEKTVTLPGGPPLIGHTDLITGLAFSRTGMLASASLDGKVIVWNTKTRSPIFTLEGYVKKLQAVAFSPGNTLAFAGDCRVLLCDLRSGSVKTQHESLSRVLSLAYSPDGSLACGFGDGSAIVWDAVGKIQVKLSGCPEGIDNIAFSPDGRKLATASSHGEKIILWGRSGKKLAELIGHSEAITSIAFSPAGDILASCGRGECIRLWDPVSGVEIEKPRGHMGAITHVAFSPDGKTLASSSYDASVILWDVICGRRLNRLKENCYAMSIAYSPNGRSLACGRYDGKISLWDPKNARKIGELDKHGQCVTDVAFSPSGDLLVSVAPKDPCLTVWNPARGMVCEIPYSCSAVTFVKEDILAFAALKQDAIVLWDIARKREIHRFSGHGRYISSLTLNAKGDRLAAGSEEKLTIWNIESGQIVTTLYDSAPRYACCAAFSPTGEIAYNQGLRKIVLWDIAQKRQKRVINSQNGYFTSLAFSPNDNFLACAAGNRLQVWDAAKLSPIQIAQNPEPFLALAFTCDGSLAYASADKISLWKDGKTRDIGGKMSAITCIACKGDILACASSDRTVSIHSIDTGKMQARFPAGSDYIKSMALLDRTITGAGDKLAITWDKNTGKEIARIKLTEHGKVRISISLGTGLPSHRTVISQNAKTLAHISSESLSLWNLPNGKRIGRIPATGVLTLALSPDGRLLALALSQRVELWQVGLQKRIGKLPVSAQILAFDGSGEFLATASASASRQEPVGQTRLELWESAGGKSYASTVVSGKVRAMALGPQGKILAVAVDSRQESFIEFWRITPQTRVIMAHMPPWSDIFGPVILSPDHAFDFRADIPGSLIEHGLKNDPQKITDFVFGLRISPSLTPIPFSRPHLWERGSAQK